MPKFTIEGALGIAAGVILFILDKTGIGGIRIYVILFLLAMGLCVDSIVRSEWAGNSAKRKACGGIGMLMIYSAFGVWIFLRPPHKKAESENKIPAIARDSRLSGEPEEKKEPPKTESPPAPKKKFPSKTKRSEPLAVLEQTIHPVIGMAASTVTKDASSRQLKIIIRLQNTSSVETTAHIGMTSTWNGAIIYPVNEPRDYAFTAQAWLEVTHPIYLSQQDEIAFLDGTGSLRIRLTAEYPDRGGKTIFVLEGRVDPKLDTVDVTKSAWTH